MTAVPTYIMWLMAAIKIVEATAKKKKNSFDGGSEVMSRLSAQGRSVSARCAPDVVLTTQVLYFR